MAAEVVIAGIEVHRAGGDVLCQYNQIVARAAAVEGHAVAVSEIGRVAAAAIVPAAVVRAGLVTAFHAGPQACVAVALVGPDEAAAARLIADHLQDEIRTVRVGRGLHENVGALVDQALIAIRVVDYEGPVVQVPAAAADRAEVIKYGPLPAVVCDAGHGDGGIVA